LFEMRSAQSHFIGFEPNSLDRRTLRANLHEAGPQQHADFMPLVYLQIGLFD
jgi:hypothetical protein